MALLCVQVLVPDRKLSEGLLATLALRPEFSRFRSYLAVRALSSSAAAVARKGFSLQLLSFLLRFTT